MCSICEANSSDSLVNRASIIFDYNEPIITPLITNVIDNLPPSSSIEPLTEKQNHIAFKVTCTATDEGSGIDWYRFYVSKDGGDFKLWATTHRTSLTFIGQNGHTYSFYSVAIDNVGNMESAPLEADVTTLIDAEESLGVNPNPFVPSRGHEIITFFGGHLANSEIKIFNKAGYLVCTLHETEGEFTLDWDATNDDGKKLASGVYIWVVSGPSGKDKGKFAIIK